MKKKCKTNIRLQTAEAAGKSLRHTGDTIASWTAVGVIVIGCAMLITAMLLPPPGEIDHSVLVAFGEICTFAGTVMGVSGARRFRRDDDRIKESNENEKNR